MLSHLGLQLAFCAGDVLRLYITDDDCWREIAFGMVPSLVGLEGSNAVISRGAENHMPGSLLLFV